MPSAGGKMVGALDDRAFRRVVDSLAPSLSLMVHVDTLKLSRVCESPIEVMLGAALLGAWKLECATRPFGEIEVFTQHDFDAFGDEKPWCACLVPQFEIAPYRVDFLLYARQPDRSTLKLIIECDGHDFHDRTKEQASSDRTRDRFLQAAGYQVFRYTGSDIHRSPFACASEVIAYADECFGAAADRADPTRGAP